MSLADQPAFPRGRVVDHNGVFEAAEQEGMTYRQWLVGMALQGLLANPLTGKDMAVVTNNTGKSARDVINELGVVAALYADAAIAAQEK